MISASVSMSGTGLEASSQRPETSFDESVAPGVVWGGPRFVNAEQTADLKHYLRSKVRTLVTVQLPKCPIALIFHTPVSRPPSWLSGLG